MENWVDIRDAAIALNVSPDTLRKRIKRGDMEGRKVPCHNGFKWQVKLDDPGNADDNDSFADFESSRTNPPDPHDHLSSGNEPASDSRRAFSGQVVQVESTLPGKSEQLYEQIISEKDKRLSEQLHHTSILEQLLSDFQGRIRLLESDNREISQQILQLPAPPEEVGKRLQEKESQLVQLKEEVEKKETVVQTLARQLKQERDESQKLQLEIEELRREIEKFKSENAEKDKEIDQLQQQFDRLEVEQSYERQKTDDLRQERKRLEKALSEIWKEKDHLAEVLSRRNRELEKTQKELEEIKRPWWQKYF